MAKAVYNGVWQVRWGNPYMPHTTPEVLVERTVQDWANASGPCKWAPPAWFDKLCALHPGYNICWTWRWVNRPDRSWPPERKAAMRQRRLRERMEKRYPMFAERFIAEELAKFPAYYAGAEYNGVKE